MELSVAILFFVLFALSQAAWQPKRTKSWVSSDRKYVIYDYPETTLWACHRKLLSSRISSFNVLFSYINGANTRKLKIPMTAPVTNAYTSNSVTTCFYLPSSVLRRCPANGYSLNCPKPTTKSDRDYQVVLKNQPPFSVLVMTLRASSNQISMREVNFFQNIIAAEGKHLNSFHREYFLTAGYSGPWTRNPVSEVWFAMKPTEVKDKENSTKVNEVTTEANNIETVLIEGNGATIID